MYRYYYFNVFETNLHFYIMLLLVYMSLNIATFSDFSLVSYSNLEKT